MAELEIKSWGIADMYDAPIEDVERGPANPRDFCVDLYVTVGVKGETGVTNYQVVVCTPLGLLTHFNEIARCVAGDARRADEYIFGKGVLIVREYNVDLIGAALEREVDNLRHYAFDVS